jgi:hypothetical protein
VSRRAAKITHVEVTRLIKAVISSGLTVQRVTFDGERVEVVTAGEPPSRKPVGGPSTFQSLEEYEAWRAQQPGMPPTGGNRTFESWEEYDAWRLKHYGF